MYKYHYMYMHVQKPIMSLILQDEKENSQDLSIATKIFIRCTCTYIPSGGNKDVHETPEVQCTYMYIHV